MAELRAHRFIQSAFGASIRIGHVVASPLNMLKMSEDKTDNNKKQIVEKVFVNMIKLLLWLSNYLIYILLYVVQMRTKKKSCNKKGSKLSREKERAFF